MRAAKPNSAAVQSAVAALLWELHSKAGCEKIGLARETFAAILSEVATKYLPEEDSEAEVRTFLLTLRVEELALARACAAGHDSACERATEKSFISPRCALPARTPPPATSPTVSMPSCTEPPHATANAFRSSPLSLDGDRSKAGFAPCWLRNL
jgi:hypothetical protein